MATSNEFKLLNIKCRKYFDILEIQLGKEIAVPNEKVKERFGFYLYMLESICNIKDPLDIIELITDTEFNKIVLDKSVDDQGVDAIYIDNESHEINLFNFKFREDFNSKKQQSINETILSTKFTNAIVNESTGHLTGVMKIKADEIISNFKGNDTWEFKLYVISNESVELDESSSQIKQLMDLYDLEVIPFGLDRITKLMSIRPEPINATIFLEHDAIIPFTENSLSSSKSYILKISVSELIRITCDNIDLRNKYNIEDINPLSKVKMEYNLLFDNVRGLIIRSKFNDNIYSTLKNESSKFFMYNNGLTMTASDIISEPTNANKKVKLTFNDFQVVNGGQTLRTLHRFNEAEADNISKYLSNCEVLLRIFKTTTHDMVKNKIAEYTNSQNAISNIDLKSLSSEQIQIEQFLNENKIIYARKTGDTGLSTTTKYDYKISMEKFGQILFSIKGNPEKASNQKKQIFDKYYNSLFQGDNFDLTMSAKYVMRYFEIKNIYDKNSKGYESSEQKIFYIHYLDSKLNKTIDELIDVLESALKEYVPSGKLASDPRKLIQTKFKEFLDTKIETLTSFSLQGIEVKSSQS